MSTQISMGPALVLLKIPGGGDVPPLTLSEAGGMALNFSSAWDAKIVTSAYWVYHNQVSKTAPTGEYLTTGSFMIRGKKNFLPPGQLVVGFGFLFKIDESCVAKHLLSRRKSREVAGGSRNSVSPDSTISQSEGPSTDLAEGGALDRGEVVEDADNTTISAKEDADSPREDEGALFPDTSISVEFDSSGSMTLETQPSNSSVALDVVEKEISSHAVTEPNTHAQTQNKARGNPQKQKQQKQRPHQEKKNQEKKNVGKQGGQAINHLKRGSRTKAKRAKEKYRDQDDEDKALAMMLLGSAGSNITEKAAEGGPKKLTKHQKKKLAKRQAELARKEASTDVESLAAHREAEVGGRGSGKKAGKGGGSAKNLEDLSKPSEADSRATAAAYAEEQKEIQDILTNENVKLLDEEMLASLSYLDSLTGNPLPDDVLLYAIPVCGPYRAIVKYKFRSKMVPGQTKRGKAANSALEAFLRKSDCTQREKDLLRAVKSEDLARSIPGKVKLAGISK